MITRAVQRNVSLRQALQRVGKRCPRRVDNRRVIKLGRVGRRLRAAAAFNDLERLHSIYDTVVVVKGAKLCDEALRLRACHRWHEQEHAPRRATAP